MKFCKTCQCETERYASGKCKPCKKVHDAAYCAANPGKIKAGKAAHYAANRESKVAKSKAYDAANRESIAARKAAYRKKNAEAIRLNNANRRALKKAAGGTLSKGLSAKLFELQRGKFACCGLELGDDFHLDHIMPLSRGGSNTDDNIQLLRGVCNMQKHARDPVEFMQSRGKLL